MTKRGIKIISYCLLLVGILYFVITTWLNVRKINQSKYEELASSDSLSSEYLNLITKENQTKTRVDQVYLSKIKNSLAKLYFEDSNVLFIYKIGSVRNISLSKIAHNEINNATESKEKVYSILTNGSYQFEYESKNVDSISAIYLTCFGDSLTTVISNDSILSYHLRCKNSSIRYSKNGTIDMLLEGTQRPFGIASVSADILFIKRNNLLYVLLLIAKPETMIKPRALFNIVHVE